MYRYCHKFVENVKCLLPVMPQKAAFPPQYSAPLGSVSANEPAGTAGSISARPELSESGRRKNRT